MKTRCLFLPLYQGTAISEVGDSKKSLNFSQKWSQYSFYNFIWRTYLASRCTPWWHWPILHQVCVSAGNAWSSSRGLLQQMAFHCILWRNSDYQDLTLVEAGINLTQSPRQPWPRPRYRLAIPYLDVQKACQRGSAAELLNSTQITEFTYFYLEFVVCFSEEWRHQITYQHLIKTPVTCTENPEFVDASTLAVQIAKEAIRTKTICREIP